MAEEIDTGSVNRRSYSQGEVGRRAMVPLVHVPPAAAFNVPDLGHGAQVDYGITSK